MTAFGPEPPTDLINAAVISEFKSVQKFSSILFGTCHTSVNNSHEESYLVSTDRMVYRYSAIHPEQCLNVWPLRSAALCPPVFIQDEDSLFVATSNSTENAFIVQQMTTTNDVQAKTIHTLPCDPFSIHYLPSHKSWILVPKRNTPNHLYLLKNFSVVSVLPNKDKRDSDVLSYRIVQKGDFYVIIMVLWNDKEKTLACHISRYDVAKNDLTTLSNTDLPIKSFPIDTVISDDGSSLYLGYKHELLVIKISNNFSCSDCFKFPIPFVLIKLALFNFGQLGLFGKDSHKIINLRLLEPQFYRHVANIQIHIQDKNTEEIKTHWQHGHLWFISQNKLYMSPNSQHLNRAYTLSSWLMEESSKMENTVIKELASIPEKVVSSVLEGKDAKTTNWLIETEKQVQKDVRILITEVSDEEFDNFLNTSRFFSEKDIAFLLQHHFDKLSSNLMEGRHEARIRRILSFEFNPRIMRQELCLLPLCNELDQLGRFGLMLLNFLNHYRVEGIDRELPAYEQLVQWLHVFIDLFILTNKVPKIGNDSYDFVYSLFETILGEVSKHLRIVEGMQKLDAILDLYSRKEKYYQRNYEEYSRQQLIFHSKTHQ